MIHRKNWIAMIVMILGLAIFIPIAQAEQQPFETITCGSQTYTVVHSSPEVYVGSWDWKSILQSTHGSKLFDNWTGHWVGITKMVEGKWSWHALDKRMGPDGEFIIWECSGDSEIGTICKPLYGTGKWKGIKGEEKSKKLTKGKPISPGTDQFCEKDIGWIELPK